ncbi:MAG: hypothetical protein ACRCRZ_02075 [Metamycoplasmataceae bacterium]
MKSKLKLRTFIIPLVTLFIYYMLVVIFNVVTKNNLSDLMAISVFVIFVIFMVLLISFGIKMIISSFKTLKFKNLGGFSKVIRLILSISLIAISIIFFILLIVLISLVFGKFGELNMSILDEIKFIGLGIVSETVGEHGTGAIEGLGPIFWIMFALMLVWSSVGIVTAILTRPKKEAKEKKAE